MTKQELDAMFAAMDDDKKGNKKFWTVEKDKEGTYPIRILPPMSKKGEVKFYFKHHTHWVNGRPYECLDQSLIDKDGKLHEATTCPICKFVDKLYKIAERDSDEWKLAGELKKRERYVSRIVVRGKDVEEEPEFFEYGPTIYNILYHIIRETDFGNIIDPKEGRDFNLAKRGLRRQAKYDTSTPSAKQTQIFDDLTKLKAVFENAMKMDYTSLIEFKQAKDLQDAIDEYLGNSKSDAPAKEETKTRTENYEKQDSVKKEEVIDKPSSSKEVIDKPSSSKEDIDSLIDEFLN